MMNGCELKTQTLTNTARLKIDKHPVITYVTADLLLCAGLKTLPIKAKLIPGILKDAAK